MGRGKRATAQLAGSGTAERRKVERLERPVEICEPFLEATHDEKQFQVVKDRERWFNVVLGQQMTLDEWSTDNLAERIPLPEEKALRLTMRLELD